MHRAGLSNWIVPWMKRPIFAILVLFSGGCTNDHDATDGVDAESSISTESKIDTPSDDSPFVPTTGLQHQPATGLRTDDKESVSTTSIPDEVLWRPRAENTLPLPWGKFHEAYIRRYFSEEELILSIVVGTLQIEDNCLYLDLRDTERVTVALGPLAYQPSRWVLSLPSDLIQYDSTRDEIWFHNRVNLAGPFSSDNEIKVNDARYLNRRSAVCGNHPILSGSSIEDCGFLHGRYRFPCTVAAYSATHGVLPAEASRRLERIPKLEAVLELLRDTESERTAGWGIDQALPYTRIGESFVAWLWLVGEDPPRPQAEAIAASHPDVEIRTGAVATYAQLRDAQQHFADGKGIFLPQDDFNGDVKRFQLSGTVAWTWIDLRSNVLEIAVDTTLVPRRAASLILTGDHDYEEKFGGLPMARLPEEIAAQIQHLIDVPFIVVDRRIHPDTLAP